MRGRNVTNDRREVTIAAHETITFEVRVQGRLVATERGYGRDHDGAELAPAKEES